MYTNCTKPAKQFIVVIPLQILTPIPLHEIAKGFDSLFLWKYRDIERICDCKHYN